MIRPELDGTVALVTGSSHGIGRELVLSLAACGASVAVHYRTSDDAAREIADVALERGAADSITVAGDVTDPEDVEALFEVIETDLGSVDVLVNNVGNFAPEHWAEIDVETWHDVIDTNLTATYLCCRRALPAMRREAYGRIVNVGYASSEKGLINPKNAPYFIAKAGVLMFTRMLAADTQAVDITANAISPYVVENSDVFPEELPRGRPATFEDVAQACLFFLEEGSGYLSGENVQIDGGWLPERV